MGFNESDTRAKLIDPAIHICGWTEDLVSREQTAGAIEIVNGKPRQQARGKVDYVLRVKVNPGTQPVAMALIEAKAESLPPTHGLEQAKAYAACKRMNVPFVFSTNGHLFVEFDRTTGLISKPCPLSEFPTPAALRARYEASAGFSLEDPAARPLITRYAGGEATRRYYQDAPFALYSKRLPAAPGPANPNGHCFHSPRAPARHSLPFKSSNALPTPGNFSELSLYVTATNCERRR